MEFGSNTTDIGQIPQILSGDFGWRVVLSFKDPIFQLCSVSAWPSLTIQSRSWCPFSPCINSTHYHILYNQITSLEVQSSIYQTENNQTRCSKIFKLSPKSLIKVLRLPSSHCHNYLPRNLLNSRLLSARLGHNFFFWLLKLM